MRPVVAGMIQAERLLDCSVDLAFIGLLNEALDVKAENDYRAHKYYQAQNNGR